MKKIPRIAYVGDLTVDRYVRQKQTRLGGSSLTGAIWATCMGASASVIAAVGDDADGKKYMASLTRRHIDASHVRALPGVTSNIDIRTTKEGERQYGSWNPGVLATYNLRPKDFAFMLKHDAAVLTVYDKTAHLLSSWQKAFSYSRKRKLLRVVDFGDLGQFDRSVSILEENLSAIDIAVFGLDKDRDETLVNELMRISISTGRVILVTLNRAGVAAFDGKKTYGYVGREIVPVDTTGAGDSFLAAFLVSYLKDHDIQKALKNGAMLASRVIQKVGAY